MSPLGTVVVLASPLPDPGTFPIVAVGTTAGMFVAGLVARLRKLPPERASLATGSGAWAGTGLGFAVWLAALAIERL